MGLAEEEVPATPLGRLSLITSGLPVAPASRAARAILQGEDVVGARLEKPGPGHERSADDTGWLEPKDVIGVPWRLAFALQSAGWSLRADIVWNKPTANPRA